MNKCKIMSKEFWDEKFNTHEYMYGKTPNLFFKDQINKLIPGKILFGAEEEGRNAVYAATLGWDVYAFDVSSVGKKKALELAKENNVNINYILKGFVDFEFEDSFFDCIVLINAHAIEDDRMNNHRKLLKYLKNGGTFILQGFTKKQIQNESGGPKDVDMLFSKDELQEDFKDLSQLNIEETYEEIKAGILHQGMANIIKLKGVK